MSVLSRSDAADGQGDGAGDFAPDWLYLREPADHAARSRVLAQRLVGFLRAVSDPPAAPDRPIVVHDLGSGTGSMARWLAPLLPGPQRWVLHDRDRVLLAEAERSCAGLLAADGSPVGVETRLTDVARLTPDDLRGASVVTASALLDLLTPAEVDGIATACAESGCAALLTLSVAGAVELDPPDDRDAAFAAAFDAHQRRTVAGRGLLGPDAVDVAASAFDRHGMAVATAPSVWRLGPDRSGLVRDWLHGWVAAAAEQDPGLPAAGYLDQRLSAGTRLSAAVHHRDLLALPSPGAGEPS